MRYLDPAYADGRAEEVAAYDELVRTAGRELLYCFAKARKLPEFGSNYLSKSLNSVLPLRRESSDSSQRLRPVDPG